MSVVPAGLPVLLRPDDRERDPATLARAVADHEARCESRPVNRMAGYESCPFRASHVASPARTPAWL